jgi:multidrug resistance protein
MGSAIIMPCLTPIAEEFKVSPTITNLSVALYMLAMSIFPLWWSSFSETLGRRTIYIVSFVLFTLFGVLSAVANSIGMLIAMRMLSGGAAASVQAVGAGTIADIWEPKERGEAMGIFYLGPLCGPLLAPIIGGLLAQGFNWRATQWFTVIYGGIMIVFIVFALPETLKPQKPLIEEAKREANVTTESETAATLEAGGEKAMQEQINSARPSVTLQRTKTTQSVAKHSKNTVVFLKRAFLDPLKIVLLLRFPAVAITVFYASIAFGSLFFLNISIEDTFSRPPYNFRVIIIGLCYIPGSLGYLLAALLGGRWLDFIMKREARKAGRYDVSGRLIFRPEDRMRENAWLAAFMFPCALFWYGWAAQEKVHWIVPVRLYKAHTLSMLTMISLVGS